MQRIQTSKSLLLLTLDCGCDITQGSLNVDASYSVLDRLGVSRRAQLADKSTIDMKLWILMVANHVAYH